MKKLLFIVMLLCATSKVFSQTPGGVPTTNMSLWLSGDNNVMDSGTLTWGDRLGAVGGTGFNAFQPLGANKPTQSELFNFHNTFTFNGSSDYLAIQSLNYLAGNTISDLYAFVVYKTDFDNNSYNGNWAFIDFDRSESYNFYIHGDGRLAMSYNNTSNNEIDLVGVTASNNNLPHIASFIFDNTTDNEVKFRLDGKEDFSTSTSSDIRIQSNRFGFIGDGSEAGSENDDRNDVYYDGDIAEIILIDKGAITATEVLQIESYLALKYGITLDNSLGGTNGDYLYFNGTTTQTVWDASFNSTYHNNVAGLIKADNYALNQRIAKSIEQDLIVSKNNNYTLANDDLSRTSLANDGDYLMFGNNGNTGFEDSTILDGSGDFLSITSSKWLFKEGTNDTGTIILRCQEVSLMKNL